jgi:GMP synthase (glutamine-hydrolysing)
MVVLATGNVVPAVAARRGQFDRLIREAVGDAWRGGWDTYDVRTPRPLPGPRDAAAFVITGSSSSVTERAPWMLRAEELVRAIARTRVPLLGICFGHQLIAQALGGEVTRNPLGREMGTARLVRTADDPAFAGLPRALDVNGTHLDAVARLPREGEVLARTPRDAVAAFRVGDTIRGLQFHPEFDADVMRGYLRARAGILRNEGRDPEAMIASVRPGSGRTILQNFAHWAQRVAGLLVLVALSFAPRVLG